MIISFEGPDSSGKSTQAKILYNKLIEIGLKVKLFHFPRYESPIGNLIGKVLQGECKISFESMQMLYAADQEDFSEELSNLLVNDYIVILDRYDLSTVAYYTAKMNIDLSVGMSIVNGWQKHLINPDITFIMNINNGLDRRDKKTLDEFEKDTEFMKNINKVYLKLANYLYNNEDRRVQVINASLTKEEIASIIGDVLNNLW